MATSGQRPVVFEVRRITTKAANTATKSADEFARKQAVIAAAEAREKAHKAKVKPVPKGEKKLPVILSHAEKRQQELERDRDAQLKQQEVPRTEEARKAMEAAKQSEAAFANELGYNPYAANKANAGQARNATVTAQHGAVGSGGGDATSKPKSKAIPTVRPPADIPAENDKHQEATDDAIVISTSPAFEEPYTAIITTNSHEDVVNSFGIMRTIVKNATTKGQDTSNGDEAAAKFRRVRLSNAKIKAAIVDLNGGLDLMMAFGFQLVEEDSESYLMFPLGTEGPRFLSAALRQMERYEKS
jgi:PUB domain